jgi:NADPH-dependent curcumin reductase CurA
MSAARSYIPPAEIGEVMRALAAGRVIASRHPGFAPGDLVHGPFGVQEHAVSDGQKRLQDRGHRPSDRRRPILACWA